MLVEVAASDASTAVEVGEALLAEVKVGPTAGDRDVQIMVVWDLVGDDRAAAESELLAKVRDGLDRREIVHRTFLDSFSRYRTTDDIGISHFAVRAADGPAAASPLVTVPAFDRAEFERKLAFLRELRTDDRLGRGPGVVGLRIEVSGPAADAPDTQSPPFTPIQRS
ncbi:hypothetical protein JCM13591A_00880 [Microbacterium xylanilyticum]